MQIPTSQLERFFTVPAAIDVTVDQDGLGYTAQLMPTLGSVDLGCEIEVKISYFELEEEDCEFEEGSKEMFVDLLTRTRDTFANMMLLGRLNVGYGGMGGLSEGDEKAFHEAMDSLPEDFFEITLEKAFAARQAMIGREVQMTEGLKTLMNVMNEEAIARGYTKEQREKMTIGDAFGLDDPKE